MNRFEKVVEILDGAVGGSTSPVGFHGAFWRGLTRNQFVARKVFGLPLVAVGDGANSNLVKALKGETPFGADLENPPPGASINRMPSGMTPVSTENIAFLEKWINDGCLEDPIPFVAPMSWRKTNAPVASSRTDDIWFVDPSTGWAVNSDGNILKTTDGGDTWSVQCSAPSVYLRSVAFANANVGWVGTLARTRRLLHTSDSGATWSDVHGLPTNSPAAICGLSVVNDNVVYASGTNRPNDVPRMMKTLDGGVTWTAWDMTSHASILIDTYFTDAFHGWVVGGKADGAFPTTRDKVKPVVLETTDGGATWTNRLAGQEASYPFGEWGWKIHFLSDSVGFVSLENFDEGAILKTNDGGRTWTRLRINDAQANANLEGIGFVDEHRGWVGGWGSRDFSKGYSSATSDGGQTWQNANEVGRFINRFRFFGNPVSVGYASGDTVYKYSAAPVPSAAPIVAGAFAARPMLPEAHLVGTTKSVTVPLNVPPHTKRLTLNVWDRFGIEIGCVLDEINPHSGNRVFTWDAKDAEDRPLADGDYIMRLIADDQIASSTLTLRTAAGSFGQAPRRDAARHSFIGIGTRTRIKTIAAIMGEYAAGQNDLQWLRDSLQIAIQLELATLPPYLTAYWTIKDSFDPAAISIREVWREEMLHFGLAGNLLAAVDGIPVLADPIVVPQYPGSLPGGIRPALIVSLKKLTQDQAKVFMDIEYPQGGPIAFGTAGLAPTYDSIGEFYRAVLNTFKILNPPLNLSRQISGRLGLYKIDTIAKVEQAILLINSQGEGSQTSPEEKPGDLSHYYRFGEIHHGKRFVRDPVTAKWDYVGGSVPLPDTWNMAQIPRGGYTQAEVPDVATWDLINSFDQYYSNMLRLLQLAWQHGDNAFLSQAIGEMAMMSDTATTLVTKPRPDGQGNYGPCFRYVP